MSDSRRFVPYVIGALVIFGLLIAGLFTGSRRLAEPPPEKPSPRPEVETVLEVRPKKLFEFPGNWDQVPKFTTTLFYPGQTSWEWLIGEKHAGSKETQAGEACQSCHARTEDELGRSLATRGDLEPDPIVGKRAAVNLDVQAAYDDEFLYMRLAWDAQDPGAYHTLWRFDGEDWQSFAGPKPISEGGSPSYEESVSVLLDEFDNVRVAPDSKAGFVTGGCFITCHNDMRGMAQGSDGVGKYLPMTRTDDKLKSDDEIRQLLQDGQFLDLWHWRAALSNPVGYGDDGYVLDDRNPDTGRVSFSLSKEGPAWMFDEKTLGFKTARLDEMQRNLELFHLIEGKTATTFDSKADFQEGDILPTALVREPEGSAGDILANGSYRDGKWTVVLRRKLDTGNPDDKKFMEGERYNLAFAVHDDFVGGRRHHVSWVYIMGLNREDVQINAVPLMTAQETQPKET